MQWVMGRTKNVDPLRVFKLSHDPCAATTVENPKMHLDTRQSKKMKSDFSPPLWENIPSQERNY